jgi:hypothetical protein
MTLKKYLGIFSLCETKHPEARSFLCIVGRIGSASRSGHVLYGNASRLAKSRSLCSEHDMRGT